MPSNLKHSHWQRTPNDGFRGHPHPGKPNDRGHEYHAVHCDKAKLDERESNWVTELGKDGFAGIGG